MKAENEPRLQEEASYAYTGRGGTAMPDNRQTEQDDRPNAADSAPARHVGSRVKLLLTGLGVWAGLRGQQTASAADVQRELNTPSMKRIVDVSPNITIPSEPGDLSKQAVQQYVDQKQGGVGIQTSRIDIPVTPPSVDLSSAQPVKESLPKDVGPIDRQAPASVKPVETPTPLDSTSNPEDIKQTELFTVPLSTVIDTATLAQLQKDWNPATNTYNAEGVFTILKSLGYDTQAKIDQLNLGSEAFSAALQAQVTGTDGKKYGIADIVAPAVTRYPNTDGSISFSLGHIAVRDLQFPDGRVVTQGSLIYSENGNNAAPFAALSIPKSSSATVKYGEAVVPVSTTQGVPVGTLEIGGYPAVAWVALDQDGTAGRVNVQKTIGTQQVELDGIDGSKTNLDPNTKVSVLTTDQDSALVMTQEHGQDVPGTIGLLYTNQLANETPATPAPQSTPNGLKQASFVRIEVNGQPGNTVSEMVITPGEIPAQYKDQYLDPTTAKVTADAKNIYINGKQFPITNPHGTTLNEVKVKDDSIVSANMYSVLGEYVGIDKTGVINNACIHTSDGKNQLCVANLAVVHVIFTEKIDGVHDQLFGAWVAKDQVGFQTDGGTSAALPLDAVLKTMKRGDIVQMLFTKGTPNHQAYIDSSFKARNNIFPDTVKEHAAAEALSNESQTAMLQNMVNNKALPSAAVIELGPVGNIIDISR